MLRSAALILTTALLLLPQQAAAAPVQKPVFKKQIKWTGTSWFGSPIVHHLGTNSAKIIGTFYDIIVWDANGNELARAPHGAGYPHPSRIYAPAVCADLDGDGIYEIVVGSGDVVAAYEWKNNGLVIKAGWPASTCSAGECPETRGLAAGDLDNNGSIEIIATTTQTRPDGAQVFAFNPNGTRYQPSGLSFQAWPRYNQNGDDATVNGPGMDHAQPCGCLAGKISPHPAIHKEEAAAPGTLHPTRPHPPLSTSTRTAARKFCMQPMTALFTAHRPLPGNYGAWTSDITGP